MVALQLVHDALHVGLVHGYPSTPVRQARICSIRVEPERQSHDEDGVGGLRTGLRDARTGLRRTKRFLLQSGVALHHLRLVFALRGASQRIAA